MEEYHNNQLVGTTALCHPIYYKSQLVGTTALCHPTHHKSIGLTQIVGLAASIAIPYAAPVIASSIGLSAAIGSATIGSAVVGGVMSALTAKITGGNPLIGALSGAVAGGIAGFNAPITAGTPGVATSVPVPAHISSGALAPVAPTGAAGLTTSYGAYTLPGEGPYALMQAAQAARVPAPYADISADLSGGASGGAVGGELADVLSGDATVVSGGLRPGGTGGPSGGTNYYTAVHPGSVTPVGSTAGQSPPIWTQGSTSPTGGTAVPNSPGFFDSLLDKITTSDAVKQGAANLVTKGLSNQFVGDTPDMSDEEQQRLAQLNAAREQQLALQNRKLGISDQLLHHATNINPLYYGQQALADNQNRLLRAQQAGLRKIPHKNALAEAAYRRRAALDMSRSGHTAFQRAQDAADAQRRQYTTAAATAAPTGNTYAAGLRGDLSDADERYKRLAAAGQDFTDFFLPIAQDIVA